MNINIFGKTLGLPVGDLLSYSRPLEYLHISRYAQIGEDDDVCDIACGNGFWSRLIARKSSSLTGIDYNPDRISWAQRKYQRPDTTFIVGNAEDMPLPTNHFTKVVSVCALEHFESDIAALREMRRIIKDGGVLALSVDTLNMDCTSEPFIEAHKERCFVVNLYDESLLADKLKKCGFEMVEYKYLTNTRFSSLIAQAAGEHRRLFQALHPLLFPLVVLLDSLFGSDSNGHKMVARAIAVPQKKTESDLTG